jgi:hypothetical protein
MDKIWNGHESTRDPTMHGDDVENVEAFQGEIDAEMERNEDLADNDYQGATVEDDPC